MEKYDRFIMPIIVMYTRVRHGVRGPWRGSYNSPIVRLIIILYYTPGVMVDDTAGVGGYCRRNWKTMFDCGKRRPVFSMSANKYTDFNWSYSKAAAGGIVFGVVHRTVISNGRSIVRYIYFYVVYNIIIFIIRIIILYYTVKPVLMDTCKISTRSLQKTFYLILNAHVI